MKLLTSTWKDIEAYLKRNTGIIIPIGSIEQHGPTGFIGTDAICADIICDKIAEKYDVIVGPTLNIGIAQHHMGFPGTLTLRPSTLISVINDILSSLHKHGFTHVYFVNGHGGNVSTIQTAFAEYYYSSSLSRDYSKRFIKCGFCNTWDFEFVKSICKKYFNGMEGHHATPSEISITHFVYPNLAKKEKVLPDVGVTFSAIYNADDFKNRYQDGRIESNPNLATAEIGKEIVYGVVDEIWRGYNKFLML